jgi:hypothetical protein
VNSYPLIADGGLNMRTQALRKDRQTTPGLGDRSIHWNILAMVGI